MSKKKKDTKELYKELYIVTFRYYNAETGFWVNRVEENVFVPTLPENEKNNHQKAEQMILKKYAGKRPVITRVVYA